MRPKGSGLSLQSGIPVLFVIKGIQKSGEINGKLAELPSSVLYLGKGSISLWSVLHSSFSSASHSLLFQLQAAILDKRVPPETEGDPCCCSLSFPGAGKSEDCFLLFYSMLCTGQRYPWIILLSYCGSQQQRKERFESVMIH